MTSRKMDEWMGLYELQTVYTDDILWKVERGVLQPLSLDETRLMQEQKKNESNHHNPGDGG